MTKNSVLLNSIKRHFDTKTKETSKHMTPAGGLAGTSAGRRFQLRSKAAFTRTTTRTSNCGRRGAIFTRPIVSRSAFKARVRPVPVHIPGPRSRYPARPYRFTKEILLLLETATFIGIYRHAVPLLFYTIPVLRATHIYRILPQKKKNWKK